MQILKEPFTAITGVNTLFIGLMNQEVFKNLDFSKMKLALGGGMAVQDAVAQQWEKLTGCALLEAYGLSETSPATTINPWNGKHQIGSIGLPLPSTDIKILDDNMKEVKLENQENCYQRPTSNERLLESS